MTSLKFYHTALYYFALNEIPAVLSIEFIYLTCRHIFVMPPTRKENQIDHWQVVLQ